MLNSNKPTIKQEQIESSEETGIAKQQKKPAGIVKKKEKWTREEHNKFVEGIVRYGMNWKHVEDFVKTKTRKQIRSYAMRNSDKLKSMGIIVSFSRPTKSPSSYSSISSSSSLPSFPTTPVTPVATLNLGSKKSDPSFPFSKTPSLAPHYPQHGSSFPIQLQTHKKEPGEAEPDYQRIFSFLTTLFNPQKVTSLGDLLTPFNNVEKKYLRLLMHNLAAMLSREQSLPDSQAVPPFPYPPPLPAMGIPGYPPQDELFLTMPHSSPPPTGQVMYPVYPPVYDPAYAQPPYAPYAYLEDLQHEQLDDDGEAFADIDTKIEVPDEHSLHEAQIETDPIIGGGLFPCL